MAQSTPQNLSKGNDSTGILGNLFLERRQFYVDPFRYSELFQATTPFISAMVSKAQVRTNLPDPIFKMWS